MKQNYFKIAVIIALAAIIAGGCKSNKQISSSPGAAEIELNACEKLQEQKPATRAVGKGTHFKESTARNVAETQARAQFARAIATAVKTATTEEALGMEQYSGDMVSGEKVTDQGAAINDLAQGIANEVVANTVVIKTTKFLLPNNQFEVWVCLEYQDGVSALAGNVAKKVQQRISDDDKLKMKFEFDQYRKRIEEELEKNR